MTAPDTVPMTLPVPAPSRTRADRTLAALREARLALGQALALLEELHPDDARVAARVRRWRLAGGVPFPDPPGGCDTERVPTQSP